MNIIFGLLTFILSVNSTLLSDNGCSCATTAAAANGTGAIGCSTKMDWTGQTSKWCLTAANCGSFQTGFGHVDSCSQVGFPSITLTKPTYLEWDQTNYTYYTGQTLLVNWTTTYIQSDEWLKITYQGTSLRTLTTGQGVNSTYGSYSIRISDTGTSITPGAVPVIMSTTNPTISGNSSQLLTVLQSKISYVSIYNGATLITAGNSLPCDDQNISVQWRGLGEAGVGIVSVTVRSSGGGGGGGTTVGTPITGLIAQGNMTVNYTLPRTFVPNGFSTYTVQISVQSPGTGIAPYTINSVSFSLTSAPSQSPSASPTPSQTPTPSLSLGSTPSNTPSKTPTPSQTIPPTPSFSSSISQSPTPSQTETSSQTGSYTPTPSTPVDLAALSKAAADASYASATIVIGASIGGVALLCIGGFIVYKIQQRRILHEKRMRKLRTMNTHNDDRRNVYGITTEITPNHQQFTNNIVYKSAASKRMTLNIGN